jgi:phosphotransferase system HPr (HPr) family protein
MISKEFIIINPTGFHTRPIRALVDTATDDYPDCEVKIIKGDRSINGKSLIHMLTLGVKYQDRITVEVTGAREAEALERLGAYLEAIYKE